MFSRIIQKRPLIALLVFAVFVLYIVTSLLNEHYIDYLWFDTQNLSVLWWTYVKLKYTHYLIGFVVSLAIYILSLGYARLRVRKNNALSRKAMGFFIFGVLFLVMFIHAPLFLNQWDARIMAIANIEYGLKDPVFQKDIGFYILKLRYYNLLANWSMLTIVFCSIVTMIFYLLSQIQVSNFQTEKIIQENRLPLSFTHTLRLALPHLAILISIFIFIAAIKFYLGRYDLIINGSSDKVAGGSYLDVHAKATGSLILAYTSAFLALFVIASALMKRARFAIMITGVWVVVYFFVLKVLPLGVYYTKVYSNQYQAEKPFITNSIKYTREAYDLHKIKRIEFPAVKKMTDDDLANNALTLKNLRIWDYQPLRKTFSQLQEFRQYYQFADIDIDRYQINNEMRQVLISGRELNHSKLPEPAQTWESRHLQYTHGYGLVLAPSNQFNEAGQPKLWIKDMPPKTNLSLNGLPKITDPSIYFGELTNTYAIVNTSLQEIHYPTADRFAATSYDAESGVTLGSTFSPRRIAFALTEGSWKFLLSQYINSKSRILYNRNIFQIVNKLAPFLTFDPDPYLVLGNDGKLYWILDAYTVSENFPYSEHLGKLDHPIRDLSNLLSYNYIRNPIKIVINAKTGKTTFYTIDENEIIISAWKQYFPFLFKSIDEFPKDLLPHIRYPERLFRAQANIYSNYHTDDTQTFYNLEDLWQLPRYGEEGGLKRGKQREPYYSVVKIPDGDREEYLLMTPFLAYKKENMISWLLARSDYTTEDSIPNRYGELLLFDFPRTKQIYGPGQIEARTNQDPDISKDLTLWNQQGSSVIRGELLIVPVGNSLLYTQSIYLESNSSPLPELRRIVASDGNAIVMSNDLTEAIQDLARKRIFISEDSTNASGTKVQPATLSSDEQLQKARQLWKEAKNHLQRGDWDSYGKTMSELEILLLNKKYNQ